MERNLQFKFFHVSSELNQSDGPSRRLLILLCHPNVGDWLRMSLAEGLVKRLIKIPLDSNVLIGRSGEPLPHFALFPSPGSSGVNLFSQNILDGRFPLPVSTF